MKFNPAAIAGETQVWAAAYAAAYIAGNGHRAAEVADTAVAAWRERAGIRPAEEKKA